MLSILEDWILYVHMCGCAFLLYLFFECGPREVYRKLQIKFINYTIVMVTKEENIQCKSRITEALDGWICSEFGRSNSKFIVKVVDFFSNYFFS